MVAAGNVCVCVCVFVLSPILPGGLNESIDYLSHALKMHTQASCGFPFPYSALILTCINVHHPLFNLSISSSSCCSPVLKSHTLQMYALYKEEMEF